MRASRLPGIPDRSYRIQPSRIEGQEHVYKVYINNIVYKLYLPFKSYHEILDL